MNRIKVFEHFEQHLNNVFYTSQKEQVAIRKMADGWAGKKQQSICYVCAFHCVVYVCVMHISSTVHTVLHQFQMLLKEDFSEKNIFFNEIGKRKGKIESYNRLLRRQLSNTANQAGGSHVRPQKIVILFFLDVSGG